VTASGQSEDYGFDDYLAALGDDWLADDPLLQRWLDQAELSRADLDLAGRFARRVPTAYRALSDIVEQPEHRPYLAGKGPYNRPDSHVVVPAETRQMLAEVHGSGLWQPGVNERARYAIVYLLNQNGEAGVTCSVACTDGLLRALRELTDDPRSAEVIARVHAATPTDWVHGAQFVTEIQGGSDAATNAVRAVPAGDGLYALHGQKWFCSNVTADYWLVTARPPDSPDGHRGVGLFCVPRRWQGAVNGHSIERLKDKLGTRALPTAEVQFTGALGWSVGRLDAGLKHMVAIVLTTSRIHNVLAAAAAGRRAYREASAYARFRRAFGRPLAEHALIAASLDQLAGEADRRQAGALAVVDQWLAALARPDDLELSLWTRVLVSIAKAAATRASSNHIYRAMMILGGNGIEERFSSLPRLWRDAAIMETWEGPYTLLLMQSLADLVRYRVAGREAHVLRRALGDHCSADAIADLAQILAAPTDSAHIVRWADLAPRLYDAFERKALAELSP
jgi:alkylation response protein AidB-like acyl-CoA dehydrogenase